MALVDLPLSYSLNSNGSLDVGGTVSGGTYTSGNELGGFKSGSISFEATTVDNSTRGEGGWAVNSPGARSCTLELTWNKLETDAAQVELVGMWTQTQANWNNKGIYIRYKSTNGKSGTELEESGFYGIFVPTAYSENQTGGGDNDATAVECSMTLVNYKELTAI